MVILPGGIANFKLTKFCFILGIYDFIRTQQEKLHLVFGAHWSLTAASSL